MGVEVAKAMAVVEVALQMLLSIVITAAVIRRDSSKLPPERLARSWNSASFWAAVVVFGPICLPVHFIKTRRTAMGVLLGVLWLAAVLIVVSFVATTVAYVTEVR